MKKMTTLYAGLLLLLNSSVFAEAAVKHIKVSDKYIDSAVIIQKP
jgi:hypothetical protein